MTAYSLKPSVLFFNLSNDERCAKIEAYLEAKGIAVRHVTGAEFGKPLGALLSLPGYEARPATPIVPFYDEMLLMCGFEEKMLQDFLGFFGREGIRRVALKAMLTPTNASWNASELYRHLSAEHAQFQRLKK